MVFLIDYALGRMGVGYQGVGLLTLLGAKSNAGIIDGQYWRLITPLFLHGGLLHLGLNSYFLYMVGRTIERAYGTARFAAIYFLSGAAGVLMSFIFSRYNSIGASSALFGIIGAWIPLLYRNRKVLANTDRQIKRIVQVILINLLIGLSPGIDNWAHVGGLIGGLALGWFTTPRYVARMIMPGHVQVTDESRQGMGWLATILFAFGLAALTLLIVALRS
jgi:rhomboid protease GluP